MTITPAPTTKSFASILNRAGRISLRPLLRVVIAGNLGDQLFQYATGILLSIINNERVEYQYDQFKFFKKYSDISSRLVTSLNFNCIFQSLEHKRRNVFRGALIRIFFSEKKINLESAPLSRRRFGTIENYEGTVRSETQLATIRKTILSTFDFSNLLATSSFSEFSELAKNDSTVGLHLVRAQGWMQPLPRFGSDEVWPPSAPINYFLNAIKDVQKDTPDAPILIFTDDTQWCMRLLPSSGHFKFVPNFSEGSLECLKLLSQCKRMILSPTSFAWWAGWLNQHPSKVVIYPGSLPADTLNVKLAWPNSWLSVTAE